MKKNLKERVKMVKAMEFIVRQVNDERIFERWLMSGVPDGDIEYGDFDEDDFNVEEMFAENDCEFCDLMDLFLSIMVETKQSGGLYCNGVSSEYA